jgi:hypothetical protein
MNSTPRLALPFLSPGQAQKEFTHNEALQILDIVAALTVEEPPRADPPPSPVLGASYIVDAGATGDWTGMSQSVAAFTSGGWRFVEPLEGMAAYVKSSSTWALYRAGAWELGILRGSSVEVDGQQVVASRAAAIASATGGTTIDTEARGAIDEILAALRHHGLIET